MWIVIEYFWTPTICTDEDGDVYYFNSEQEAKEWGEYNCQNPYYLQLN